MMPADQWAARCPTIPVESSVAEIMRVRANFIRQVQADALRHAASLTKARDAEGWTNLKLLARAFEHEALKLAAPNHKS